MQHAMGTAFRLCLAVIFGLVPLACTSSSVAMSHNEQAAQTVKVTSDSASDEVAIQALYASWRAAVKSGDIPKYMSVLHPEVKLFPPGAPPIVNASRYAKFLEPVFAAADYRVEVTQLQQVQVMGDIAVAEYEYIIHLTLKNPDVGITEPGALTAPKSRARYFDVLRKKPNGQWGVWRHLWQDLAL